MDDSHRQPTLTFRGGKLPSPAGLQASPVRALGLVRDASLLGLAVFAVFLHATVFRHYIFEDAYITFRYADNLANGNGFVFNVGERVLGTSTPLFTLLLGALGALGFDIPATAGFLYALCLSLIALGGAWLLRRWGFFNAAVVYALTVLWGSGEILRFFSMETTFYTCLLLATLISALERRPVATGVFLGLAFLTRHDAFLLAAALFLVLWISERRIPWRTGFAAAAVVAPWLVFAFFYFGSVLPNTLGAKSRDVAVADYMYVSVAYLTEALFSPVARYLDPFQYPNILCALLLLALIGPVFAQTARLVRRERLVVLLLVFPLLVWLGYSLIGPPVAHRWYLVPGLYLLLLLAFLAWGLSLEGRRSAPRFAGSAPGPALLALLLVVASWIALPDGVRTELEKRTRSGIYRSRVDAYGLFAQWITDLGMNDLSIFTLEPGYLAYRSKNPVVDGAGLVTAGIFFHGPEERRSSTAEILEAHAPELYLGGRMQLSTGSPEGYVEVYSRSFRSLHLAEELFRDRLEALSRRWLGGAYEHSAPVELRHPLVFDFDAEPPGWAGSDSRFFVGHPRPLRYGGKPWGGSYLHTLGAPSGQNVIESPPFRIDFDEVSFLWSGNQGRATRAQLLVNGLVVLEATGRPDLTGRMESISWPVHSWRGKVGALRFFDLSPRHTWVAADRVRSSRYRDRLLFDDFESDGYGERWRETFGQDPLSFRDLAARHGLRVILGERSAASLRSIGPARMKSRPFAIERDRMAFVVLDFGDHRTRVVLESRGEAVRRFVGTGSGGPAGVIWDVSRLRGQEVTLAVIDQDPRPDGWIGIDDIVFFEGLATP